MVKTDCLLFKGDIPCRPHKKYNVICSDCTYYKKINKNILIIKLGAIGDVIRTTPLLERLEKVYPDSQIFWLTYSPEILPPDRVQKIMGVTIENLELIKNIEFDIVYNLDKDPLAIALANSIKAKKTYGFTIDVNGRAKPISSEAENHKWMTGLFDTLNKENTKHYVEEIFDICGFEFGGEEYIIDIPDIEVKVDIDRSKKVIGLNTGCGGRWTSRLWPETHWVELAKMLIKNNYEVVLLGGQLEHEKNLSIQKQTGAKYFGTFSLKEFIVLIDKCDIIVTAVTMAMHLAIGLKKPLILFNNIFNKNEFHLYNRGMILEPDFECGCYFTPTCPNNCMQYLNPKKVYDSIISIK